MDVPSQGSGASFPAAARGAYGAALRTRKRDTLFACEVKNDGDEAAQRDRQQEQGGRDDDDDHDAGSLTRWRPSRLRASIVEIGPVERHLTVSPRRAHEVPSSLIQCRSTTGRQQGFAKVSTM